MKAQVYEVVAPEFGGGGGCITRAKFKNWLKKANFGHFVLLTGEGVSGEADPSTGNVPHDPPPSCRH